MPEFSFKAYAKDGALVADRVAAASAADAVRALAARGLVAFEVKAGLRANSRATKARISLTTLSAFCRQMATMTASQLPIDEALALIATDRDAKPAALARELRLSVLQGMPLSQALAAHSARIPEFMIGLVAAGESGSALSPVFERLADGFENQLRLTETLRSALIYPAILSITALASLLIVLTVVAPALAPVFAGAGDKAPASAKFLMGASELVRSYWWAGLIAVLIGVLVVSRVLQSTPGRAALSRLALKTPFIGPVMINTEASRFLHALAALLENGVSVLNALSITQGAAGNPVVARDIARITEQVRQGGRLGSALSQSRVFPGMAGQMAIVGERSGGLVRMLRHGGRALEETAQRDVKRLMAAATPVITILLGLLVGGVVLSLLSAIMSVNDLATS